MLWLKHKKLMICTRQHKMTTKTRWILLSLKDLAMSTSSRIIKSTTDPITSCNLKSLNNNNKLKHPSKILRKSSKLIKKELKEGKRLKGTERLIKKIWRRSSWQSKLVRRNKKPRKSTFVNNFLTLSHTKSRRAEGKLLHMHLIPILLLMQLGFRKLNWRNKSSDQRNKYLAKARLLNC